MPILLICTLGGSVEPLAASILHDQPERILFICSAQTRCLVETRLQQLLSAEKHELRPGDHDFLELLDPQALETCVEQMHHRLTPEVTRWVERGASFEVVVDFTGGTKCMSSALCLVARRWSCRLRYVGGSARTKEGIGVVVSGSEVVLQSRNPWDALGYQTAEDAMLLCDQGSPAAAGALLEQAAMQLSEPHVKRALHTLRAIARGLNLWDRFEHAGALSELDNADKNRNDLHYFLAEERVRGLCLDLSVCRRHLRDLLAEPERVYGPLAVDLLANAGRRMREGRFDDAVARCYRAVEALAQARLSESHAIPSTKKVSLDRLPASLREQWQARAAGGGTVMLGLQDAYRLLRELGDDLGQRFFAMQLGQENRKNNPLKARNEAIVGHGDRPVRQKSAELLFDAAIELAGIRPQDLIQFPLFRPPAALHAKGTAL